MQYRHEYKFPLSACDVLPLQSRLRAVLPPDAHTDETHAYQIRSIYFDTPGNRALRQKLDGVNAREKFRIRFYNGDLSHIRPEKKCKVNGLGGKQSVPLSRAEAAALLEGVPLPPDPGRPLLTELLAKGQYEQLRPKTLVDYRREPFVFPAANVRVTLDSGLRTGPAAGAKALTQAAVTIPAGAQTALLEVKYDAFLPDLIRDLVGLGHRQAAAFSKYAACRVYG